MKMDTTSVTWYEDGGLLEWWTGEGRPQDRKCKKCALEDAIQFAYSEKMLLYIQTAFQDQGFFVDYTERR